MVDTLIGRKVNMLTVIRRVDDRKIGKANYKYYLCKCDCGNYTVVRGSYLQSKHTKSCGCQIGLKKTKIRVTREIDEDKTRQTAMRMWKDMKLACYYVGSPLYNGAHMCEEWRNFDNFYTWFLRAKINDPCRIVFTSKNRVYSPFNCRLVRKKGIDAKELPKID